MNLLSGKICVFVAGASNPRALPHPHFPEIAFVGRSNVGKSSLLNALLGRQALARVSRTPGRTRQINFFCLENALNLVDLPGYGYARAPRKMIEDWEHLILIYLRDRPTLKRVFVLIDSRHGLKPSDQLMMDFLNEAGVPHQIILTKIDKISKPSLASTVRVIEEVVCGHKAGLLPLIPTSSTDKKGFEALRKDLLEFIGASCIRL